MKKILFIIPFILLLTACGELQLEGTVSIDKQPETGGTTNPGSDGGETTNPGGDGGSTIDPCGDGGSTIDPGGDGDGGGTTTEPGVIDMSKFNPKTDLFPKELLYGRSLLTDEEEIKAYDFIMESFIHYKVTPENEANVQIILDFDAGGINVTEEQVVKIYDYVTSDDPRIMMLTSTIVPRKSSNANDIYGAKSKTKAKLAYFDSFFKGVAIKQNIETYYLPHLDEMDINVKDILSVIKDDMTEAQKVRAVYDKFLSTVSYGEKNSRGSGNIRGAFLNMPQPTDPPIRFVVCQGYAQGLNYLLKRVGIQSIMIVGEGLASPGNPSKANHAWNKVKIDGKWYILDGTHDDSMIWYSTTCKHDYFLKSDNDEIIKTTRVEGVMVDGSKGGYGVFPPANESMDISLTEYNK